MNIFPIMIALFVGILVCLIGVLLMPKQYTANITNFTRRQLKTLEKNIPDEDIEDYSVIRDEYAQTGILASIFYSLPFGKFSHPYLVRGGMAGSVDKLFIVCLFVFIATAMFLPMAEVSNNPVVIIVSAVLTAYFVGWAIIRQKIKRRMRNFVEQFPDALDIIVRSVRSGFPLNAAVNMVAESMNAPASEEFHQVSTEIVHGSTMVDALARLGERMETPDIRFFVVVLTLQQEVGGNLAEVLSNLSTLIRKRKMMKKKIYAITAEGRITGWILSGLPLFVALAVHAMSPDYLVPLFTTDSGNMLLAVIMGVIFIGTLIIRKMVDLEI